MLANEPMTPIIPPKLTKKYETILLIGLWGNLYHQQLLKLIFYLRFYNIIRT